MPDIPATHLRLSTARDDQPCIRCKPRTEMRGDGSALHRITPHRCCSELPILSTRAFFQDSALSPIHRRHSALLILGTLPSPDIGTYHTTWLSCV